MPKLDLTKLESAVLDALMEGTSINKLVDKIYSICGLPMLTFDVTFNMIAYAFPRPFYLPGWELLAAEGNAPEKLVLSNNYLKFEEQPNAARSSLIVDSANDSRFKTAFGSIWDGDTLLGYHATMLEGNDADEVISLNNLMCQAASIIKTDTHSRISSAHIFGMLMNSNNSHDYYAAFEEAQPGGYILAKLHSDSAGSATANYVSNSINENNAHFVSTIEDGNILWVLGSGIVGLNISQLLALLQNIANKYNYVAGVSDSFSDLRLLHTARIQASSCLELRPYYPEEQLLLFQRHLLDCFCISTLEKGLQPGYHLKNIMRLKNCGADIADALIETLDVYLNCLQHSAAAAQVLKLHKNTVNYRMQRIQGILNVNIKEPAVSERLLIELALYKLYGKAGELHGK